MAEIEIRLRIDPQTRKKTVTIKYESESDALPMEHEEEHRRIVSTLLHKGLVNAEEAEDLVIERLVETDQGETELSAEPQGERASVDSSQGE